jgi:hypothetical protein
MYKGIVFSILLLMLVGCGGGGSDGGSSSRATTPPHDAETPDDANGSGSLPIPSFNAISFDSHPECSSETPDVFFTLTDSFDTDSAYLALLATLLVEDEVETARKQFSSWGFSSVNVWNHSWNGMRLYVAEHDEFVFVIFRGTTKAIEYVSNAMFLTTPTEDYTEGRAHAGIWNTFKASRDEIHQIISDMGGAEKPVVFAGHSRGAAFSTLQAAYFSEQGGDVASIYSFAQPRLGNSALATNLDSLIGDRYYRMKYELDVTPQVAPTSDAALQLYEEGYFPLWLGEEIANLGYDYDAGAMVMLSEQGVLHLDPDPHEWQMAFWHDLFNNNPNLILSLPAIIKSFPVNHNPRMYICRLSETFQ